MISLIIPTMWFAEKFCDELIKLTNLSIIDEIILINNNKNNTPDHFILNHSKIQMNVMEENIYVNPSWNLGAKLAKNEVIAFLGDDVEVNLNFFERAYKLIQEKKETIGIVSVLCRHPGYEHIFDKYYTDNSIQFYSVQDPDPEKTPPQIGLGNLFILQKKDWIEIPEQTKIFHGEALIWYYLNRFKEHFLAVNCTIETNWHTTWNKLSEIDDSLFSAIHKSDQQFCESIDFDIRKLQSIMESP